MFRKLTSAAVMLAVLALGLFSAGCVVVDPHPRGYYRHYQGPGYHPRPPYYYGYRHPR